MTPEERASEKAVEAIKDSLFHPLTAVQVAQRRLGYMKAWIEQVEPLEAWKESAIKVLGEWDKVHEALGQPGKLGESTARASLVEVLKLRALVQRFVNHNAKWVGKGCLDADIEWDEIIGESKEQGFAPTNTEDK